MSLGLRLGSIATLQLAVSFGMQLAVLAILGAREQTDAYVAAQAVPLVVFAILAGSLQSVWLPRMAAVRDRSGEWRSAQRSAYGQSLLLFGTVGSALVATAPWWQVRLFPGLDQEQHGLVRTMLPPLLLAVLLDGQMVLQTAALRARERLVRGELIVLAATLVAFVAVVMVVPRLGIRALPWILFGRSAVSCVVLFFQAGCVMPSVASGLKEASAWLQLRMIVSSSSLDKTMPLVDRFWTSQAATGGMTLYGLGMTAATAISTILERSLYMPTVARMGQLFATGQHDAFRHEFRQALIRASWVIAALGLLLLIFKPAWSLVLSAILGSSTGQADVLWWFLVLLLGQAHAGAAGPASIAAFHAMGNVRVPARMSALGYAAGALLKSIGFVTWGLMGLALATSVYQVLLTASLLTGLKSQLRGSRPMPTAIPH